MFSVTVLKHMLKLRRWMRFPADLLACASGEEFSWIHCARSARSWPIHIALLFFLIRPALALNPNQQISQYGHSVWRLQDGVFPGTPHAITQTADGYIWVGGAGGLVRFDGARFVRWSPPGSAKMVESVFSLLGTRDGTLWVGASNGFGRLNGGSFDFRQIGRVNALVEDAGGAVWIALSRMGNSADGPLCRAGHDTLQCFGGAQGIGFRNQ